MDGRFKIQPPFLNSSSSTRAHPTPLLAARSSPSTYHPTNVGITRGTLVVVSHGVHIWVALRASMSLRVP